MLLHTHKNTAAATTHIHTTTRKKREKIYGEKKWKDGQSSDKLQRFPMDFMNHSKDISFLAQSLLCRNAARNNEIITFDEGVCRDQEVPFG
jgi:hypothetical protein